MYPSFAAAYLTAIVLSLVSRDWTFLSTFSLKAERLPLALCSFDFADGARGIAMNWGVGAEIYARIYYLDIYGIKNVFMYTGSHTRRRTAFPLA